ncbi:DNA circularization N-terminal domain-containing protein [Tianweitania sp. BSSL-BM11]|uniref:DNA circularization N-terminal domain-containing protein n=1 Tax=Tianweitania aestuarii TaxID=2814886 RepID=A0ABS5RT88_9HYPH|nr:DNA circularization N-terminal domain-containing protein [Tianweitania aestuarii]
MRNWNRAFRRASFRGVRFWVDDDGPQKGRRVAVHEISGGDTPVVEDMGRSAIEFAVSAYLASDLADVEGLSLEAACNAYGPGLLTLPMDPAQMALCIGCRRNRAKDRNGFIGYDLRFVEAGGGGLAVVTGLPALRDVFSSGLSGVVSALAGAFR